MNLTATDPYRLIFAELNLQRALAEREEIILLLSEILILLLCPAVETTPVNSKYQLKSFD